MRNYPVYRRFVSVLAVAALLAAARSAPAQDLGAPGLGGAPLAATSRTGRGRSRAQDGGRFHQAGRRWNRPVIHRGHHARGRAYLFHHAARRRHRSAPRSRSKYAGRASIGKFQTATKPKIKSHKTPFPAFPWRSSRARSSGSRRSNLRGREAGVGEDCRQGRHAALRRQRLRDAEGLQVHGHLSARCTPEKEPPRAPKEHGAPTAEPNGRGAGCNQNSGDTDRQRRNDEHHSAGRPDDFRAAGNFPRKDLKWSKFTTVANLGELVGGVNLESVKANVQH